LYRCERELQPKALLRVRADISDRLVNEAGESPSRARSRIEGEMRAVKAACRTHRQRPTIARALREIEIQAESQMQSRLELPQGVHA